MNITQAAAALEQIAQGFHQLALAVAEGSHPPTGYGTEQTPPYSSPPPPAQPPGPTASTCGCGGRVVYAEGVSQKTGKPWRMWRCERSRQGETHFTEWIR